MLSNSFCSRESTASESFPAPDLASSTEALRATLPSNPAGVIFRVSKTRRLHRRAEDLAMADPASCSPAFFFVSFPEKRRSHFRVFNPASASFWIRSMSCFSMAFNMRRTLAIRKKSKTNQTLTSNSKMTKPKVGTSPHACQPIGSKNTLRVKTTRGGMVKAMISFVTSNPIPRIGSSRSALKAHPA